jgi:hypothetical protein
LAVLDGRLTSQAARVALETAEFLVLLEVFDRRGGWVGDGVRSCVHWMNWQLGIGERAAFEQLRVARALAVLPVMKAAFGRGELSYSRVRVITRVALPETETGLVEMARVSTAAQLERIVSTLIKLDRQDNPVPVTAPELSRREDDEGRVVLTLKVDPADGELAWNAIDAAMTYGPDKPVGERRADALVAVADSYLAHGPADRSGSDRAQVTVHVNEKSDVATLTDGTVVDESTRRRLECEASRITVSEDGTPGRNTPGVSPRLRRMLMLRDRLCRWPGCSAEHFLHAHHVVHRADHGPTVLDNLILLCGHHHRVLHADGFDITRSDHGSWIFHRPDGSVVDPIPKQATAPRSSRRAPVPPRLTIVSKWDGTRLNTRDIDPIPILRPDRQANDPDDGQLPETGRLDSDLSVRSYLKRGDTA